MRKQTRTVADNVVGAKDSKDGICFFELLELNVDWAPWTYCVRTFVYDGKNYQRPGLITCIGWCNFESEKKAWEFYDRL